MNYWRPRFMLNRLRYDTWLQRLLDALKVVTISINPFLIFREEPRAGTTAPPRLPQGFTVARLERRHLDHLPDYPDRIFRPGAFQQRLDAGDICFAAWQDGRLVAFSWACPTEFRCGLYRFDLLPHEAYLYDAYTERANRGKGLAGHLRATMYRFLAGEGRIVLYSVSQRFNAPAIRFKEKLGARVVDRCVYIRLFHFFRFGTRARPAKVRVVR